MIEEKMLVWRFNRGDKQALRRIYEKYRQDMLKVAAALLIDRSRIEDVVHDVFVSFARQSGSFRLTGSLKGFLAVSVANRVRDCNKKLHRESCAAEQASESIRRGNDGPEGAVMKKELRQLLAAAIEQLPEDQKEIIVLRLQTRLRFRELARARGVSIHTIQSRYRYGLERLRNRLNGELLP